MVVPSVFLSRKCAKVKALTRRTQLEIRVWPFTWLFQSHYFVSVWKLLLFWRILRNPLCVVGVFKVIVCRVEIHDFRRPSHWQLWLTSWAALWQLPLPVLLEVYLSFALSITEFTTDRDSSAYILSDWCVFCDMVSVCPFCCGTWPFSTNWCLSWLNFESSRCLTYANTW